MKIIILIVCLAALLGCGTILKRTDDLANAVIANDLILSGQVAETVKKIELNDFENTAVSHATNSYANFVEKWKHSITDLDVASPVFNEFVRDYSDLVRQYKMVESVVEKHWLAYSHDDQIILQNYKHRAKKLDESVGNLIAAGRRHQALLDALAFGRILVGLAQAL